MMLYILCLPLSMKCNNLLVIHPAAVFNTVVLTAVMSYESTMPMITTLQMTNLMLGNCEYKDSHMQMLYSSFYYMKHYTSIYCLLHSLWMLVNCSESRYNKVMLLLYLHMAFCAWLHYYSAENTTSV